MPQINIFDQNLHLIISDELGSAISQSQFRQWLATADLSPKGQRFCDNIPADPYNAVNIGWNGPYVRENDQLWVAAKIWLGFSPAQMDAGYLAAAALQVSP